MDFDFNKILDSITAFFTYIFSGKIFVEFFLLTIGISVNIVIFVFGLLPNLPQLPANVYQNIITYFDFPFSSGAIGFIGWIFGDWTVLSFVIISSLLIFSFRISYDFAMFIITKFPVGVKR